MKRYLKKIILLVSVLSMEQLTEEVAKDIAAKPE